VVVAALLAVLPGCAPKKVKRAPIVYRAPDTTWPRPEVFEVAERAWRCGWAAGEFDSAILTVVDFSLPSTERRLWVIDMLNRRVLNNEFVAHGEGSGELQAVSFSNRMGSNQSSLGLFRTQNTYYGGQGYSLRLEGLEPGVNDHAMERRVVVHGADYADASVVAAFGRLGRSHGCLALPRSSVASIIDQIKWGSAVFAYYPDPDWLAESRFLRCDGTQTASR